MHLRNVLRDCHGGARLPMPFRKHIVGSAAVCNMGLAKCCNVGAWRPLQPRPAPSWLPPPVYAANACKHHKHTNISNNTVPLKLLLNNAVVPSPRWSLVILTLQSPLSAFKIIFISIVLLTILLVRFLLFTLIFLLLSAYPSHLLDQLPLHPPLWLCCLPAHQHQFLQHDYSVSSPGSQTLVNGVAAWSREDCVAAASSVVDEVVAVSLSHYSQSTLTVLLHYSCMTIISGVERKLD